MSDHIERAYQILESVGVSRERAGSVANGIMVFDQRMRRELMALKARVEALERELAKRAQITTAEFNSITAEYTATIAALNARVAELTEALWAASKAAFDAKPSAQTKAECDCPSLHGGRCMYPDCSQAASTVEPK